MSPVALGFFALVPVALVLVAQWAHLGFGGSIASSLPVADPNVWSGCASALAHFSTPENLEFCLRRPLTMFLMAPVFAAAPTSISAVIVLQTLLLSTLFWWFLCALQNALPVRVFTMWLVALLGVWPIAYYGTQLSIEGSALALTLLSAAAVLRFLASGRLIWAFVAGGTALLTLQMRPGNPLLTLAIVTGAVVAAWRASRRWSTTTLMAVGFGLLWWLPDQLLRWAGWANAGHSTNFWSTVYSSATPANDTWEAAYARFAPEVGCAPTGTPDQCLGLESQHFADLMREGAIQAVRDNPLGLVRQGLSNTSELLTSGYLNKVLTIPYPARIWKAGQFADSTFLLNVIGLAVATLLLLASVLLAVALVVAVVRMRRGATMPSVLQDIAPSQLRALKISLWLGLITLAGLVAFYAFVGQDEQQRHMVQSIPFILLAIGATVTAFIGVRTKTRAQQTPAREPRRWPAAVLGLLAITVVVGAAVEGHVKGETILLARSCSEGASLQEYQIVGQARWGSGVASGPTAWRELANTSTRSLPQFDWMQQQLLKLPSGSLMRVSSTAAGEQLPVFLSDDVAASMSSGQGPMALCTMVPSRYGSFIVHDLEPYTGSPN